MQLIQLPIIDIKDIAINSDDICEILNIKPSKIISDVIKDLKNNILAVIKLNFIT